MRIAVISDTHDHVTRIDRAVALANDEACAMLLHLGDVISPFAALRFKNFKGTVRAVFGNNDGEKPGLMRVFSSFKATIENPPLTLELEGKKILLLHDPIRLEETAEAQEHDYILYGHLHKIDLRHLGRTTILNPGDASGWLAEPTFFIVDLESGECRQMEIDGGLS